MKDRELLLTANATPTAKEKSTPDFPILVEAEKMFEKVAAVTRETAARAYDYFVERGSEVGSHVEDWLRAEAQTLRTAPVKITDSNNKVKVTIAVPGFKAEEITVTVKDDLLIVSGEAAAEDVNEDEDMYYSEWTSNKFLRKLMLPGPVQADSVEATLQGGILTLVLLKKAGEPATKIAVRAA